MSTQTLAIIVFGGLLVLYVFLSAIYIGPTEIGLVAKRFGRKLSENQVIAFKHEAGYQAALLMPGLRFKPWLIYSVRKYPWVQIPADGIGVVIAQVGAPLPAGAKSAAYRPEFGNFGDVTSFVRGGGQQGVQRPVLPPGSLVPVHPIGFLVLTYARTFGVPVSPSLVAVAQRKGQLSYESFGLQQGELKVVRIAPQGDVDFVGIVTTQEGDPLPSGDIAGRLGGFEDVTQMEVAGKTDSEIMDALLGSKNVLHNNYQDFQAFLDHGGKIGLQHDPLLYGAYLLNPFLVKVELAPMLVVNQGQVAVIKSYLGLSTQDTSGQEFKFGSIVRPGHRGIWNEPLRTGKFPLNPRVYQAEIVPTAILTLNWAEATSHAHNRCAALVDRREEPRGIHLPHRPAGADPRAGHDGAEGDLDGGDDAQPGERGASVRGRELLPEHVAGLTRGCVHPDPPGGPEPGGDLHHGVSRPLQRRDPRRVHPGRGASRAARRGSLGA